MACVDFERIVLLSDLNSKIPVTIEPEGYQSILSGTGKNNGIIQYSKEEIFLKEDLPFKPVLSYNSLLSNSSP